MEAQPELYKRLAKSFRKLGELFFFVDNGSNSDWKIKSKVFWWGNHLWRKTRCIFFCLNLFSEHSGRIYEFGASWDGTLTKSLSKPWNNLKDCCFFSESRSNSNLNFFASITFCWENHIVLRFFSSTRCTINLNTCFVRIWYCGGLAGASQKLSKLLRHCCFPLYSKWIKLNLFCILLSIIGCWGRHILRVFCSSTWCTIFLFCEDIRSILDWFSDRKGRRHGCGGSSWSMSLLSRKNIYNVFYLFLFHICRFFFCKIHEHKFWKDLWFCEGSTLRECQDNLLNYGFSFESNRIQVWKFSIDHFLHRSTYVTLFYHQSEPPLNVFCEGVLVFSFHKKYIFEAKPEPNKNLKILRFVLSAENRSNRSFANCRLLFVEENIYQVHFFPLQSTLFYISVTIQTHICL